MQNRNANNSPVTNTPAADKGHLPVLLNETLSILQLRPDITVIDATFGGGGHSRAILESAPGIRLFALDRDPAAQPRAQSLQQQFPSQFTLIDTDFANIGNITALQQNPADAILFDLGVSSFQLDTPERGFSFRNDAPADMRMDPRKGIPASEWLEITSEENLTRAIRDYGEEKHWRRIVRAILNARNTGTFTRTASLAELIAGAIPARDRATSKIHPATRSFQGIRIALNDELRAIEIALPAAFKLLRPAGILAVISFHSLEDRIVKQYFNHICGRPVSNEDHRPQDLREKHAALLASRPISPSDAEVAANLRSRSSKLRAIQKL